MLVQGARELGLPVVVTEQYPQGLGDTVPEVAEHLDGVERHAKTVFSAARADGFDLAGREQALVCGIEAHVCVEQTVQDLLDRGRRGPRRRRRRLLAHRAQPAPGPREDGARGRLAHLDRDGAVRAARRGRHRPSSRRSRSSSCEAQPDLRYVLLEDGTRFDGDACGAPGPVTGEVVFNTAMSGYQEAMTDPSYAGQLITFTYPHIGNYGVSERAMESDRVHARAAIMRAAVNREDAPGAERPWFDWLADCGVPGHHRRGHSRAGAPHPRRGRDARRRVPADHGGGSRRAS